MGVYYPSSLVGLQVRLERPVPKGTAPEDTALPVTGSPLVPAPGRRMSEMVQVDASDPYTFAIGCVPRSVEWTEKGLREANDARVTLAWSDLPLDPRTIRSCVVQVFAGQAEARAWQDGIMARDGEIAGRSVVAPSDDNLRFIGHLDEHGLEAGDDGTTLALRARDFTALFLDREVPGDTLRKLDLGQPLLPAVQEIVSSLAAAGSMRVEADADVAVQCQTVRLSQSDQRHVLGTDGKTKRGSQAQAQAKVTYWDLITGLCLLAGIVPVIDLYRLRLRLPATLYTETAILAPKMIWGGNLESFKVTRRWGRSSLQPVEVRCLDQSGKRVMVGRYPVNPRAEATPSGRGGSTTYDVKVVYGKTQDQLDPIAKAAYFEKAVGQCEVELETEDMTSFPAAGESPVNLLSLRAGGPVLVLVKDVRTGQVTPLFRPETTDEMAGKSPQALAVDLQRRGVKASVASALAMALAQSRHINAFRVQQITHRIDASDGYRCSMKCGTYLEIDPAQAGS